MSPTGERPFRVALLNDPEWIKARMRSGARMDDLARELGTSPASVSRACARHGIDTASLGKGPVLLWREVMADAEEPPEFRGLLAEAEDPDAPDEELVRRARSGYAYARDELLRRYAAILEQGDDEAADAAMRGMVRALTRFVEGRGATFAIYAALCATRHVAVAAVNRERRANRERGWAWPERAWHRDMHPDAPLSRLAPAPRREARPDILAASRTARSLTALEAEALMFYLGGCDTAEVAAETGLTLAEADATLRRARAAALGEAPRRRAPSPATTWAEHATIPIVPTVRQEEEPMAETRPTPAAPQGESWADRVEREAREQVDSLDARIAEARAVVEELERDALVARSILEAVRGQRPAVEERVADVIREPEPEPEPEPEAQTTVEQQIAEVEAEPEAEPEPEPKDSPQRALVLDLLATNGPITTKSLRERGVEDVRETIDALRDEGLVLWTPAVIGPDGFPYVRLPDQPVPDDAAAQPSDAERAKRKREVQDEVPSDAKQARRRDALAAAERLGIFTIKRLLAELGYPDSKRIALGADLAALNEVVRHGGNRGPNVFFTHKSYTGEATVDLARGGEPLRKKKAPEPQPEPQPEAVDPATIAMPADEGGTEAAARDQRKLFNALRERETGVVSELAEATGIPHLRAKAALRLLAEAGIVERTGRNRRAEGQKAGRPGTEYAPRPEHRPVQGTAAEAPEAEADPDAEPRLEDVRDAVRDAGGEVTMGSLAMRNDWDIDVVERRMKTLAARGIVSDVGLDGAPVFVYVKPAGPGKAAEAQKRLGISGNGASVATDRQPRGSVVGGTGRGPKISDPDVRALIEDARRAGCGAELAPNGHWRIKTPDGKTVLISNTPRNPRSVRNDRARLRQRGVAV